MKPVVSRLNGLRRVDRREPPYSESAEDLHLSDKLGELRTRWVHQSQEAFPDVVLTHSELYQEFLWRYNLFHQYKAIMAHEQTRSAILTILRSKDAANFLPVIICSGIARRLGG